jgi:hypothetical protein
LSSLYNVLGRALEQAFFYGSDEAIPPSMDRLDEVLVASIVPNGLVRCHGVLFQYVQSCMIQNIPQLLL